MTKGKRSVPHSWLQQIWNLLGLIGIASVISAVSHVDVITHWLQHPTLKIEILNFHGRRELNSFDQHGKPVFDQLVVQLNIVPQVRYRIGTFPANQVKGISVKKGDWYGLFQIDREIPFTVRDEPIPLKLSIYHIPIEGPQGQAVEIRIVDRWGQSARALIENQF